VTMRLSGTVTEIYVKKTCQFTTVCKDDVIISVFINYINVIYE